MRSEIARALTVWSRVTPLTFEYRRPVRGPSQDHVDIDIKFEVGDHGDADPFDGLGGTLAHAFFPVWGGDIHFDKEEKFTKGRDYGTNLMQTSAHEFGHSLGLRCSDMIQDFNIHRNDECFRHSDVKDALMSPFYRGYQPEVTLHPDDVAGITELYGARREEAATRPPTQRPLPPVQPPPSPAPPGPSGGGGGGAGGGAIVFPGGGGRPGVEARA